MYLFIFLFLVPERKISIGSIHSIQKQSEKQSKGRHVVIRTDVEDSKTRINLSTINSTASYENAVSNRMPLLHEHRHTTSHARTRPSSLNLNKAEGKPLRSIAKRSKSIDNSQKEEKKEKKNFESLHRLKEKLLYSSPDLNEGSDNESTPLVSEVSSPSKSGQSSEAKTSSSKSFPCPPFHKKVCPLKSHYTNALEVNKISQKQLM